MDDLWWRDIHASPDRKAWWPMKLSLCRFRRNVSASLLVTAMLSATSMLLPTASATTAASGIFDAACAGKPAAYIIKNYPEKDGTQDPLRCGTSGFGYIHIRDRHGFLANTDGEIAYTLKNYESFKNDSPTAITYFAGAQQSGYRVVVEQLAYDDGYAKGIITAY